MPGKSQIRKFNTYETTDNADGTNNEELLTLICGIREIRVIRGQDFLRFSAGDIVTPKIITRPSIPRTSCGGSSSNTNESPARSRTAAVASNDLPTVFVRPWMREATLTV